MPPDTAAHAGSAPEAPEPPPRTPETPPAEIDAAIERLYANKDTWRAVSISARAALLDRCVAGIAASAERWAAAGARIKGLRPDENAAGEEWVAGILPAIRNARLLADALRQGGAPKPRALRTRADGRTVARVFPESTLAGVMFPGVTGEVWIKPGEAPSQGAIYRAPRRAGEPPEEGRVCLVLGGGNVSSIPAMDALYKLFVDDEVVLLKMNPVNESIGPVLEEALAPLVSEGVLAIVYGGADAGARAAEHPKVGSLHVTGSDRTYDAIVWGSDPEERAARKRSGDRKNTRDFSAELGCVTPVIVVPGPWSKSDIRFQARHVASMVTQNASFNCNAAKVIVTARGWLQREAFLDAVHEELRRSPPRRAYYPGARARYDAFLERYPGALVLGAPQTESVPWTAIPDVPEDAGGYALVNEAFCGVVAEVALDVASRDAGGGMLRERDHGGPSVPRFLERACGFANERCWGTLSCCLLVEPSTVDEHHEALARAVTELRYGAIGVNVWPGVIYALGSPSWGAYPGHTPEDIQSGTGVVHDAFLFDHPEKSVVRAPFRMPFTPPWFTDHGNLLALGRRLVDFEAKPSWRKLPGIAAAALRG
jgi:hypothetical protein